MTDRGEPEGKKRKLNEEGESSESEPTFPAKKPSEQELFAEYAKLKTRAEQNAWTKEKFQYGIETAQEAMEARFQHPVTDAELGEIVWQPMEGIASLAQDKTVGEGIARGQLFMDIRPAKQYFVVNGLTRPPTKCPTSKFLSRLEKNKRELPKNTPRGPKAGTGTALHFNGTGQQYGGRPAREGPGGASLGGGRSSFGGGSSQGSRRKWS